MSSLPDNAAPPTALALPHHPGLGWWNLYFLIKFALFAQGKIDFHVLENVSLAGLLLMPVRHRWLNVLRQIAAVPLALWLFHYDSFMPPLKRLTAQLDQLLAFEPGYLLELLLRFVPASAMLGLVILVAAYYFLAKIFRISVIVIAIMLIIGAGNLTPTPPSAPTIGTDSDRAGSPRAQGSADDAALNNYLENFFADEKGRQVAFPQGLPEQPDFDILLLSICSLSWDDLTISGAADHPFFKRFDLVFDNFNSATSYSGPALLRLTRAGCGQPSHSALYQPAPEQCQLFQNLKQLGYREALIMNHDGKFDGLLQRTQRYGGIDAELISQEGVEVTQKAFAGSPVYRDKEMLQRWWQQRLNHPQHPEIALYNSATLHDGNRLMNSAPVFGVESYRQRAQSLLDDLDSFTDELEKSGRNVVLILVPEHGGGLRGDKMQISGMREIPSPSITHVPVGVKLIGPGIKRSDAPVRVATPTSHMALGQVISNILQMKIYAGLGSFSARTLAAGMPETAAVSQNEGSTVIKYNDAHFISLDNQTWTRYPDQ